ncbi:IS66 family insertion sequence element accessory protein TnpA [Roseiconus lacunae]|uniref:IS66 family insertion sequence element accessory protein TnpA n=1 Tax=Roseiconus lacunae TaxID=2605694 RepID=UPI0036F32FE3
MDRFRSQSLSVKEFCRREGVSVPSFYQWRKKLARVEAVPQFLSVAVRPPSVEPVTVRLPGGSKLEFDPRLDDDSIRRVIRGIIAATDSE